MTNRKIFEKSRVWEFSFTTNGTRGLGVGLSATVLFSMQGVLGLISSHSPTKQNKSQNKAELLTLAHKGSTASALTVILNTSLQSQTDDPGKAVLLSLVFSVLITFRREK